MENSNTESKTENIPSKKSGNKKKIIAAVACAAAVVYIGGAVYFHNRFLPGTTMNGTKISGKTIEQVADTVKEKQDSYTLTLKGRQDYKEVIKGSDIGYTAKVGSSLKDGLAKQSSLLWFVGASGDTKKLAADVTYDEKKLKKAVKNLSCFDKENIIKPVNATIKLNDEGKFVQVKEVMGTKVDKDKLTAAVDKALASESATLNINKAKCYVDPKIYKGDKVLKDSIKKANAMAKETITYDFKYTTEEVTPDMIKSWIKFDIDTGEPKISYKKALKYVEKLAHKYDTYSTVRTIKDQSGNKHKVYYGDYGWKISQTKEAKKLMKVILKGKSVTREPIYMYKAVCRKKGNIDWDDTYVLVNITNQEMCYVKNGKTVLSTSVVTGDPTKGHSTPTGTYQIMYKVTDQYLTGANYSSHVNWFMPFTTNTGFHDASWRSSFGGGEYYGNGSHGCVNMPSSLAHELYNTLEVGTPVFVYK